MEEIVIQPRRRTFAKVLLLLFSILSVVGVMFFIYSRQMVDKTTVINGVPVPPEPNIIINNVTLAGVDSNGNGVRDDIDRIIARQFGGTLDYPFALAYAQGYQKIVIDPAPANKAAALFILSNIRCSMKAGSDAVWTFKILVLTGNTKLRQAAFQNFFDTLGGITGGELQPCVTD